MDIDDLGKVLILDKSKIFTSLVHFPDQCLQGWNSTQEIISKEKFSSIGNICCFGMGGSLLGARLCYHVYEQDLKIPFSYHGDYHIPGYVDENTLAIVVSTSGNTEETISSYKEIKKRTKNIIGITTGGELEKLCKKDNFPVYIIDDHKFNPSGVPRVAVGFQIGSIIAILSHLKLIDISNKKFNEVMLVLKEKNKLLELEVETVQNPAKQFAKQLLNRIPVIISSEHIVGAGKSLNNQLNESGKNFSSYFVLPEVNHHQLEGMQFPKSNKDNLIYLLLESNLYHPRDQKRYSILKKILTRLEIPFVSYKPSNGSKLSQALETFQFGSYVTYYLGLLNNVDPAPNPFVDEFKEELNN